LAGKMTRSELIHTLSYQSNLPMNEIHSFIDDLLEKIKKDVLAGKAIELRGFGTFELAWRKGRKKARNPKTGETVSVEDHGVVRFRPGRELKSEAWDRK